MNLDDRMRSRLSDLADADEDPIDEGARQRVVAAVAEPAPRLIRRAQIVHVAVRAGAVAAAMIVAGAALWMWPRETAPVLVATSSDRCKSFAKVEDLSLGVRGRLELEPSTSLVLVEPGPCSVGFWLHRGRVTVFADDLGNGSLSIIAGGERVMVRGTVFSVERIDDAITVEVREGRVEVVHPSGGTEVLSAGQRWATPAPDPAPEAPPIRLSKRPLRPKKIEPPPQIAEEDPEELVARADELAKEGRLPEARRFYLRAGALSGGTAEAAWIALAKMELRAGKLDQARSALDFRARLFPSGGLELEATWLAVKVERARGREEEARRLARDVISRWPDSAQAREAKLWLEE